MSSRRSFIAWLFGVVGAAAAVAGMSAALVASADRGAGVPPVPGRDGFVRAPERYDDESFIDIGQFFRGDEIVALVSPRELFTAVQLRHASEIAFPANHCPGDSAGSFWTGYLQFAVTLPAGAKLSLLVAPEQGQAFRFDRHSGFQPGTSTFSDTCDVAATQADGDLEGPLTFTLSVQSDPGYDTSRVLVDARGHLWVARSPTPGDAVVDWYTGSRLDLNGVRTLGRTSSPTEGSSAAYCAGRCVPLTATTYCDPDCRLVVYVQPGAVVLLAPMDGTLSCGDDGASVLQSGRPDDGLRIKFAALTAEVGGIHQDCLSMSGAVTSGQVLAPSGQFAVWAETADGQPWSIAIARDGSATYTGDFHPPVGCPCRGGT